MIAAWRCKALWQKEAARQDFERALELDPNLTDARENLAKLNPPLGGAR